METILGILGLIAYIAFVLAFSSTVTWAVIKISPSQSAKQASKTS